MALMLVVGTCGAVFAASKKGAGGSKTKSKASTGTSKKSSGESKSHKKSE
jgi:hypothetical protein